MNSEACFRFSTRKTSGTEALKETKAVQMFDDCNGRRFSDRFTSLRTKQLRHFTSHSEADDRRAQHAKRTRICLPSPRDDGGELKAVVANFSFCLSHRVRSILPPSSSSSPSSLLFHLDSQYNRRPFSPIAAAVCHRISRRRFPAKQRKGEEVFAFVRATCTYTVLHVLLRKYSLTLPRHGYNSVNWRQFAKKKHFAKL